MRTTLRKMRPAIAANRHPWLRRGLLSALLLLVLAAPALGGPSPSATARALTPLPGDTDSWAFNINNRGQAVGQSIGAFTTAVVWDRDGNATPLLPLPGDVSSFAEAINNRGQVAGYSRGDDPCGIDTGVVWDQHGVPTRLTKLAGDAGSRGFSISDSGEVTGTSLAPFDPATCFTNFTPVRWDRDGNIAQLPYLPGFTQGFGQDINNRDQVAGGSIDATFATFPFITAQWWNTDNVATALAPPNGYFNAAANGINNRGQVVGETFDILSGANDRAVVWDRRGNATALPPLAGDPSSAAQAINNRGAVAGSSGTDLFGVFALPQGTAVIWDKHGVPTALQPLAGDVASLAFGINEPGHVVGYSRDAAGTTTAVVWR